MNPLSWSSLPPLSALPSLSVPELKALLVQVDHLDTSLDVFPEEWGAWVEERVPADIVAEVREGMMMAVVRGRHRYTDALRQFVDKAERESLPADHSVVMIQVTRRLKAAHAWGLFAPEQQEALAAGLDGLSGTPLREGAIPEREWRWERLLSTAVQVLDHPRRELLAGLDSGMVRERLVQELEALGSFTPTAQAIEWTRIQMSSWGNDASTYSAESLMRREYDRRKAFLSDWLNELGPAA